MAEKKNSLIWRTTALNALEDIYFYIAENNPGNAAAFIERMLDFGESLVLLPEKFKLCRFKKYAKRGYHCAVFEKNYMFVYSIKAHKVYIYMIHHVSRLK
jgi:plasmid stabilization system protein ParE